MINRLIKMMSEYDIEFTKSHELIIRTSIKPSDLVFIRNYLNKYKIYYKNIIVESWN